MDSYDIAISGLNAAQQAFEVIGNNISNAATEGYHCQRLNLTPAYSAQVGDALLGGGVDIAEVTRSIDTLLEKEIYRQQSSLACVSEELSTLETVEAMFGELSSESGLSVAIDDYFSALKELSAHPSEIIYQEQVVSAAENIASRFQVVDSYLTNLETQIVQEADNVVQEINSLTESIAQLNSTIQRLQMNGGDAGNICDQRDQCISELSELVDIQCQTRDFGVVDVTIAGIPVVTGNNSNELEAGLDENGILGISIVGDSNYISDIEGGELGGLLSLKNSIISEIHDKFNNLASEIINQVNQSHVQGVGSDGSFTDITGWTMLSEDLADIQPPVSDGNIYIRITDLNTGEVTRAAISVDVSEDTMTSIADKITAVTGISASVFNSKLDIQADEGYEFDFLPAVLSEPTVSDFTGTVSPPEISVSGIYSGTENQTLTFNVVGSGSVGNGTLQIEVVDSNGDKIETLNVGSGYAAGDSLDIGNGITIALSTGDLVDGNVFEVDVYSQSDTTGLLAATGINTFFSGQDASDIAVCSEISDSPGRIAVSIGGDMTDNENILSLVELEDTQLSALDDMTFSEYYRNMVTDIGLEISTREILGENIGASLQNLSNQQSELSGVNINDEAAQLLLFEQMFQGVSKYLATLQDSITTLMEII